MGDPEVALRCTLSLSLLLPIRRNGRLGCLCGPHDNCPACMKRQLNQAALDTAIFIRQRKSLLDSGGFRGICETRSVRCRLMYATQLLTKRPPRPEEERDARRHALVADAAHPVRMHWRAVRVFLPPTITHWIPVRL